MKIVEVQGVRFNFRFTFDDLKKELKLGLTLEKKGRPFIIFTPNPEQVVQAGENSLFKNCLNSSDLNLIDGVGIVWYLRWRQGMKTKRRSGVDVAWQLLSFLDENEGKVFLLGGSKESNRLALLGLNKRFPHLKMEGVGGGRVDEEGRVEDEKRIIKKIDNFQPDLLLIAFGAPKQEFFSCRYRDRLKAKMVMVVGGAFDYWAGLVPRAPRWVQKLGFEWLFRLLSQPWRLKRQIRLVKFLLYV